MCLSCILYAHDANFHSLKYLITIKHLQREGFILIVIGARAVKPTPIPKEKPTSHTL